jgi:small-conductance mechanosensitive channel
MEFWDRLITVSVVIAVTFVVAKLVDRRISRRDLQPEAVTRYRVLRRSVMTAIVFVGLLFAALVIPQVQAIAGGLLASSALLGLVIGLAAQRPLANFVSGLVIAVTQPLRFGDRVTVGDSEGTVEEIGLTYTFIRTDQNERVVIPNEKLASDTIRNSTIVSPEKLAEVTVPVPLDRDLTAVVDLLRSETAADSRSEVSVSALEEKATLTVRAWAPNPAAAERLENEIRLRVHARLRAEGLL